MSGRVGLALVVVASLASAVWGGTILDTASPADYLTLGADEAYASVGLIQTAAKGGKGYYGSGTLISPNWVLTAGHMVDRINTLVFTLGGINYKADKWTAYPNWNGNLSTGYDVAMVHLSTPVAGVTPAGRYTGSAEIGGTGVFVGYGTTGNGLTGGTTFDLQKRAGLNMIDSSSASGRILLADFDNPLVAFDSHYGSSQPLDMEYLIAPGDSGGGLFMDFGSGPLLVGVHSFVMAWDGSTNSDYGDASGDIRVSSFNSWIDSILAGGSGGGKGKGGKGAAETPMFADPLNVPEPASLLLLAGGLGALLRRRR